MRSAENMALPETRGAVTEKPVLIYDGECPACIRAVDWIRARSDPDAFEFLSCHADELAKRFPRIEKSACLQAMHLVLPDSTVFIGELAVPEILRRLPRYRRFVSLFRFPGTGILSRVFYRWFANRRHRIAKIIFPPPSRT
jgi:predicted DCC family thiol-disulfide oxidoreductase YuxK